MIRAFLKYIAIALGTYEPAYRWLWKGEPGTPKFIMKFSDKGFDFLATLTVSKSRPAALGRFSFYPEPGSVSCGNGKYFVPTLQPESEAHQLVQQGMPDLKARRKIADRIQSQILQVVDYENGRYALWRMTVIVKRGSTALASETVDDIFVDPGMLLYGDCESVNKIAFDAREILIARAVLELQSLVAQQMMIRSQ